MKRGGLCTYAAVTQIVNDRRIERMLVFLGVAAWATFILLPLHWLSPSDISLSSTHYELGIALLGGAILGLGAYFNRGCFFGTFVALVSGNINYIATLLGLSIGVTVTHFYLSTDIPSGIEMSPVSEPYSIAYIWLFAMIIFALFMLFSIKIKEENILKKKTGLYLLNWQSISAMIVIGLGGTLLYAIVSGWNYADVLANSTLKFVDKQAMGASSMAILSTLFMIVGGISASVIAKEFSVSKVQWYLVFGCFAGGILMGGASMFIPGGNDGLLLKGIPSLAPHAFVGYFAMIVSMLVLVYFFRNTRK
ncbi:Integral membrane protein [hydrothermal vent metagenome]|uniref:Integral membrane protein n=1 Tax=hydrothermal vent metagenome TaxID=652676 RepID=A0A1W1CWF0_9ZZZZ